MSPFTCWAFEPEDLFLRLILLFFCSVLINTSLEAHSPESSQEAAPTRSSQERSLTQEFPTDKKVYVFRENSQGIWTVWDRPQGKHLFYAKELFLEEGEFYVDESIRQIVLQTGKKRPHAGVIGRIIPASPDLSTTSWRGVRYNPFDMSHFQLASNQRPVARAKRIHFDPDGKNIRAYYPQYYQGDCRRAARSLANSPSLQ
jgi:hypothetical protein